MVSETKKPKRDAAFAQSDEHIFLRAGESTTGETTVENEEHMQSPESKGDELIGKVLDSKYQIIDLLGKGGMSAVYLARHQWMKKMVAIKILRSERAEDVVAYKRLQQESQACGAMVHPNLVAVHDFGITTSGIPYVVMDYVDGKTLSELIQQEGKQSFEYLIEVFIQACDALIYAHKHGVIHRDLKPGNIMVSDNSEGKPEVKIVDFGIAKVLPTGEEEHKLTQTGETFGSPAYMSPEQCLAGKLDSRSDIYSMGCVLYEAFCGHAPFNGTSMYEVIHKHLNISPPPMVTPGLGDALRSRLELVIMKALAKDPDDRQNSMTELKEDLESLRLHAKEDLVSRLTGTAQLWYMRSSKMLGAAATVGALLLLVTAFLGLGGTWLVLNVGEDYERALDGVNQNDVAFTSLPVGCGESACPGAEALTAGDYHYMLGSFRASMGFYADGLNALARYKAQYPQIWFLAGTRYCDTSLRAGNLETCATELPRVLKFGRDNNLLNPEVEATLLSEIGEAHRRLLLHRRELNEFESPEVIGNKPEFAFEKMKSGSPLTFKEDSNDNNQNAPKRIPTVFNDAVSSFQEAAQLWEKIPGGAKNAALCWSELGAMYFDLGRHHAKEVTRVNFDKADHYYQKAISLMQKDRTLQKSAEMGGILDRYFVLQWRQHRYIDGIVTHQKSAEIMKRYNNSVKNGESI